MFEFGARFKNYTWQGLGFNFCCSVSVLCYKTLHIKYIKGILYVYVHSQQPMNGMLAKNEQICQTICGEFWKEPENEVIS